MKHPYLDTKKPEEERPLPTIDQMVSLFEALDSNKNGFLTSEDMRNFIENIDKLKQVNFDLFLLGEKGNDFAVKYFE